MANLEHIKLLESKITKAIGYVKKVSNENSALKQRLDTYQGRIDELENLLKKYKEEQSKFDDRILSILDSLNQLEDAAENAVSRELPPRELPPAVKPAPKASKPENPVKPQAAVKPENTTVKQQIKPDDTKDLEPEPDTIDPLDNKSELDIF